MKTELTFQQQKVMNLLMQEIKNRIAGEVDWPYSDDLVIAAVRAYFAQFTAEPIVVESDAESGSLSFTITLPIHNHPILGTVDFADKIIIRIVDPIMAAAEHPPPEPTRTLH